MPKPKKSSYFNDDKMTSIRKKISEFQKILLNLANFKTNVMKYLKFCFIALLVSCNSSVNTPPQMPGTYLMVSQTVNNGTKNMNYTDLKQLKIYTDHYMMYTQLNPNDSISGFGVGTYTSDTGGVKENTIYRASGTTADTTAPVFSLKITKTSEGYNQVIPDIVIDSQKSTLTEVYQKIGNTTKSPLDGVWKETESYTVKGNDTSRNNRIQYKAFYNGYFMYGQTLKNGSSYQTGMGFGTFVGIGDNKIKETDLNSSFPVNAGHSFEIAYELNGTDNYKQTINYPDSSISVEVYERLK